MKKTIALLMAVLMVCSLAASKTTNDGDKTPTPTTAPNNNSGNNDNTDNTNKDPIKLVL